MRIHYLQHVAFEGLGSIADWARSQGASIRYSRMFDNEALPNLADFDWLLVLGGPMNIYEEDLYPWLRREKACIKEAIAAGKVVLGICLGAQLIADALGAAVSRNPQREVGWFPLTTVHQGLAGIIPAQALVMHWHGDTFAMPNGAERLAASEACQNQGFIYRQRVLGLQFHLETTPESLIALIDHGQDDLAPGPCVQTPAEMLAQPSRFTAINQMMAALLDHMRGLT